MMRSVLCVMLLAAAAMAGPPLTEREYTIAQTMYGPVRGIIANNTRHFLGIPYAAPPVGDLRWRSPVAPTSWTDARDALAFSPDCPQRDSVMHSVTSEDCLYINVYAPVNVTGLLPVMLYIHGGGYLEGGSSSPIYTGEYVVQQANVIVVTFNYRIGSLGFLGTPLLRDRTSDGSYGNYGLQDQRFAMQWVQRNIQNFGGNPVKVMLFGESAGAGLTAAHMVAPKSAGLFQAAGLQSGSFTFWQAVRAPVAAHVFDMFVNFTQCRDFPNNTVIDCLMRLDPDTLVAAQAQIKGDSLETIVAWAPVVDGVEFSDTPETLAANSAFSNQVPTLLGINTYEFEAVKRTTFENMTEPEYLGFLNETFGDAAQMILNNYPSSDYASPAWALEAIMTDFAFICPARRTAKWTAKAGQYAYYYQFNHRPIATIIPNCINTPCHASELPFVFKVPQLIRSPAELTLSTTMVTYWTQLASTGDPNVGDLFYWPYFQRISNEVSLVLQEELTTVRGLRASQCNFWDVARIIVPTIEDNFVRLLQPLFHN